MGYRNIQAEACNKHLKIYNIAFIKLDNLIKALTHPTFAYENKITENNQRLEFLGDTILGFIITEFLYCSYPFKNEGELSKIKGELVSKKSLKEIATKIQLYKFICVGKGEIKSKGVYKESILGDSFEALIAAIYLDLGYQTIKKFICNIFYFKLKILLKDGINDYKTNLQELVQKKYKKNVIYKVIKEIGPSHKKIFTTGIFWKNKLIASSNGKNKKESENNSAKIAINYFLNKNNTM